jgi:CHAT domain/Lecithin:cholesterol acyltransferase
VTAADTQDPTLVHLRERLAAGDMEGVRRALLQLSDTGRQVLEARLGAPAVARIVQDVRRLRGRVNGRVVVIHGIMGGRLASRDQRGDEELVWVHYPRLILGRIGDFALDADGGPADPSLSVVVCGLLDEYLPLVMELDRAWDVLPFAFDWRLDIDRSAQLLDEAIRRWAGNEPVHIVAHSMGGLVARRFLQQFPQTWQRMADPNQLRQGGRLVMLGTPNRGSFAIPFVLTGEEKTVRVLELFDLAHDMGELLAIINTFQGSYQMLPSPRLPFGDDRLQLYRAGTWGRFPVAQANLDLGRRFQEALDPVIDPERLVYVAGFDQPTPFRIRVDGQGRFSYRETLLGDGRVPHELGLLPGVPSFFVREAHGELPSNAQVLAALPELLASGTTRTLPTQPPADRALAPPGPWRQAKDLAPMAPAIQALAGARATPARLRKLPADAQAQVEAEMLSPYIAVRRPPPLPAPPPERGPRKGSRRVGALRIRLEVMWADIVRAPGEVYAVGHYQGVLPQGGERALDAKVSGVSATTNDTDREMVIASHTRRGMLRGAVGDINFFPWAGARKTVAVAGMGHPGTFGRPELTRLARSLAESVRAVPGARTLNMLLIGSGNGNLPIPVACAALVEGLSEVFAAELRHASLRRPSLRTVRIVERDWKQAQAIDRALQRLKSSLPADRLGGIVIARKAVTGPGGRIGDDIALSAVLVAAARRLQSGTAATRRQARSAILQPIPTQDGLRERCADALAGLAPQGRGDLLALADAVGFGHLHERPTAPGARAPTRMSFIRDEQGVRVAAISDSALVPERVVAFSWSLVDEIIERMTDPADLAQIPDMAALMARLLVPRDFRALLGDGANLIFEVDRDTARIHWEMLGKLGDDATSAVPLALDAPVARQLRTSYSPPPSRAVPSGAPLRALVVGDPGDPERGLSLEGAQREALEVTALLRGHGVTVDVLIGAPNTPRDGPLRDIAPATVFDVLHLLGRQSYDLLHFAGHADFDPEQPERAGWMFGHELFTARDLGSVDRVPALVVANACLSGLASNRRASGAGRGRMRHTDDALLPGLADEFFRRGVRNYVGTAWEISDIGAVMFARTLYGAMLQPPRLSLGEALVRARTLLRSEESAFGALWAAYQHYGDPAFGWPV